MTIKILTFFILPEGLKLDIRSEYYNLYSILNVQYYNNNILHTMCNVKCVQCTHKQFCLYILWYKSTNIYV